MTPVARAAFPGARAAKDTGSTVDEIRKRTPADPITASGLQVGWRGRWLKRAGTGERVKGWGGGVVWGEVGGGGGRGKRGGGGGGNSRGGEY